MTLILLSATSIMGIELKQGIELSENFSQVEPKEIQKPSSSEFLENTRLGEAIESVKENW